MRHDIVTFLGVLSTLTLASHPALGQARPGRGAAPPASHAQTAKESDEEDEVMIKVEGGGKIPVGWTARVDRNDSLTKIKFEPTVEGWHARTAAAVMLFRGSDTARGNYRVTVTMAQTEGSPGHTEPYGLLLGASSLAGVPGKQRYTSFVVEGNGKFQIRRRADAKGSDVTNGSVESKAVHKMDDKGRCSNELSVVVGTQDVRFLINGVEVHRAKRAEVDTDGIVGFRISHNLDLNISGFKVTQG